MSGRGAAARSGEGAKCLEGAKGAAHAKGAAGAAKRLLVSSGRGPIEARRFVALLGRAIVARCGGRVVACAGDVDAPASLLVEVPVGVAGDALSAWVGTHVLVAPLRGGNARRRWFVAVRTALPEVAPGAVGPVRVTAARAGGPGGQNVNRRATAVRAEATALGIAVRVTESRSQAQNRRVAEARLLARVRGAEADAHARRRAEERRTHDHLERGRPVATWRLEGAGIVAARGS